MLLIFTSSAWQIFESAIDDRQWPSEELERGRNKLQTSKDSDAFRSLHNI